MVFLSLHRLAPALIPISICIVSPFSGAQADDLPAMPLKAPAAHAILAADFTAFAPPPNKALAANDSMPTKAPKAPSAYDWSGFYLGGHIGYEWAKSNWTASAAGAPFASGSLDMTKSIDIFKESGSWFEGLQTGYNYMFPNRLVIGAEADITGASFPDPFNGFSTGGQAFLQNGNEV
jgi:opacity protein-like surface antigen